MFETARDSKVYKRAVDRAMEKVTLPSAEETFLTFMRRVAIAGIEAFEDEIDQGRYARSRDLRDALSGLYFRTDLDPELKTMIGTVLKL
jgi:hypothetical protein